jgi:hypothetical protein
MYQHHAGCTWKQEACCRTALWHMFPWAVDIVSYCSAGSDRSHVHAMSMVSAKPLLMTMVQAPRSCLCSCPCTGGGVSAASGQQV